MEIQIGHTYVAKDKKIDRKIVVIRAGVKKNTWFCHDLMTGDTYIFRENQLSLYLSPEGSGA